MFVEFILPLLCAFISLCAAYSARNSKKSSLEDLAEINRICAGISKTTVDSQPQSPPTKCQCGVGGVSVKLVRQPQPNPNVRAARIVED